KPRTKTAQEVPALPSSLGARAASLAPHYSSLRCGAICLKQTSIAAVLHRRKGSASVPRHRLLAIEQQHVPLDDPGPVLMGILPIGRPDLGCRHCKEQWEATQRRPFLRHPEPPVS